MNITRETIKETLKNVMAEEADYKVFFKKALEKAGKSIPSMSDEEKKEFFNKIDAAWNAKGEKNEGNAFGAAVVAAKEKGEDEFEVGGKTYQVEESASCSCGCGTCSEAVNEAATDRDFEKVFNLFNKKDYFDLKGSIKTMLGNWQRALDRGDKGAQQYSKEDVINSVTAQTKARAKHTYDELAKAIKNKDIKALKSKLRHDQKFSIAIFTQVTGKKLPKSTRDIHSFLDNEFMNESLTEGRAFINAARKAKEEGKTEFEFNGKTYPVTLKESINELNPRLNKKVKSYLDAYLKGEKKNSPEHQHAIMLIMKGALTDANFHSEARQLDKLFPKAKQSKYVGTKMEDVIEDKGIDIAGWAKWDGHDIIDAFAFYTNMQIGGGFGNKLTSLKESINEGKKSKDSTGIRKVVAIYNNVDTIIDLIFKDKKDVKEVVGTMGPVLVNAINATLKHKFKPTAGNEDKLKQFKSKLKELLKLVETLIKKPSKAGIKRLETMHRNWWNHSFGADIVFNGKYADSIIESVNEGVSVFDERHFGKKGIIIMIDDNGKKVSAIFKDKKNADKYNRNNPSDIKKLLDLAKKTKYPKAIDESVNEARLGKVSLLKTVESGDSSRVEGVKISPELAFELRMFLQRPMLARTRTGIAIDNAQMKDAIGMLAKVGVQKRLSSGVKKEFDNLLKKYK